MPSASDMVLCQTRLKNNMVRTSTMVTGCSLLIEKKNTVLDHTEGDGIMSDIFVVF